MGNDLNQIVIYDLVNDEVLKIIQEFKTCFVSLLISFSLTFVASVSA